MWYRVKFEIAQPDGKTFLGTLPVEAQSEELARQNAQHVLEQEHPDSNLLLLECISEADTQQ